MEAINNIRVSAAMGIESYLAYGVTKFSKKRNTINKRLALKIIFFASLLLMLSKIKKIKLRYSISVYKNK